MFLFVPRQERRRNEPHAVSVEMSSARAARMLFFEFPVRFATHLPSHYLSACRHVWVKDRVKSQFNSSSVWLTSSQCRGGPSLARKVLCSCSFDEGRGRGALVLVFVLPTIFSRSVEVSRSFVYKYAHAPCPNSSCSPILSWHRSTSLHCSFHLDCSAQWRIVRFSFYSPLPSFSRSSFQWYRQGL